ncbi:MAG: glycosyl transferase family 1 [Candidatus Omnitrophica bacterium CG07_land_8_20_14_0_80_42_15]|uniref:Glycosyl transferase family 1 n=1 Tax=Candidatus Aquitaenariimonas noxiae TaxID=1974741 RepID=A0A2J0L561_9BACT|nr:MAG: glycosyl transferase family 1 [Candidatus Omnitrophica bacterium CG07_land_8_20_14_0_80_42_15]
MNTTKINEYAAVVGQPIIDDLKLLSKRLKGKVIQNINSTAVGGGVAEILSRMVPLLRELNIDTHWDVIKGGRQFFDVTKKFHNALHGRPEEINQRDLDIFLEISQNNIEEMDIYGDIVFVHDPQPIVLVKKKKENKWIWRCHIDVSSPNQMIWEFLEDFIFNYDAAVFSSPAFSPKLPIRQFLISPSIDPLSDKNRELPQETIDGVLRKYEIYKSKPIITQISRFDRLKDPLGVIEVYKQVKRYRDCQLLLAGGGASDDPEGKKVLEEVKDKAKHDPDIHILLLPQNDIEINALQRASTVIIQKSIKEGFGLTVTEALWKAKPVVASNVGGIPLQITHKYSGLLCNSIEGAGFAIKQLLNSPEYAKKLGENGREHVRNNFLLTRHLKDYMLLFLSLYHREDVVYL